MALIRKVDPEWKPSEKTDLQVGDTIEISDYRRLVELGTGELVDDSGNVLPLPGTVFVCGICFDKIGSHIEYVDHVMKNHASVAPKKPLGGEDPVPTAAEPGDKEINGITIPASFGEKMAKARAAAKAKREAAKKKVNE